MVGPSNAIVSLGPALPLFGWFAAFHGCGGGGRWVEVGEVGMVVEKGGGREVAAAVVISGGGGSGGR